MRDCQLGCGGEIEFVTIQLKSGIRKPHPVDSVDDLHPEGRVVWDDALGCYRILDARLKREKDGSIGPRCGQAWPVDGGAIRSHMDTCSVLLTRRMQEKRRAKPRTEQEEIEREIEEASSHIQRCRAPHCGLPMDEALSGDEAWTTHPSCDPRHRLDDDALWGLAERNRLTGRRDIRAADVAPSWSGEELAEIQRNAAERLVQDRLRRAQETVDTEWQQGAFGGLSEEPE